MTKPSGMWSLDEIGKTRVSGCRGAYVVSTIFTPGELTGTAQAMAYASSPGFIALVGIVIISWLRVEGLLVLLAGHHGAGSLLRVCVGAVTRRRRGATLPPRRGDSARL